MLHEGEWQEMLRGIYQGGIVCNRQMKELTSLRIGGPADLLAVPEDPLSVRNLLALLKEKGIPFCSLGGGTNLLVRDGGIEGAVIYLRKFRRIEVLKEDSLTAEIFAEAGVPLARLLQFCRERGYSGIEGLAGIPGTVGGAVCGNAGSYGTEMKDVLESAVIMDAGGRLERVRPERLGLEYRHSEIGPTDIVLSVNLRLKREERETVASRADAFLLEKKGTQPIGERSAGCVFRNPRKDLSAGRLIDEAGCKGMSMGGVTVSTLHANFFINTGSGTAEDFIHLMDRVAARVHDTCGVRLDPEVRVVGRA